MNNCKQNCDKGFNIVDVSFYYSIHIFMFFKLDVLAILTLRVLSTLEFSVDKKTCRVS